MSTATFSMSTEACRQASESTQPISRLESRQNEKCRQKPAPWLEGAPHNLRNFIRVALALAALAGAIVIDNLRLINLFHVLARLLHAFTASILGIERARGGVVHRHSF